MIRRMPTAGTPLSFGETVGGVLGFAEREKVIADFRSVLRNFLEVENLSVVNSGTTAFFILLQLFKQLRSSENRDEVILPAYTAPSLLLPIQAAGLKARLIDIDSSTFNMDVKKLPSVVSERTLAVMPIHMFGLPCKVEPIIALAKNHGFFVVEDAASSLGTTIDGKQTGTIAPFGFYSLNRGKNISTMAGGIIVWKDKRLSQKIENLVTDLETLPPHAQAIMTLKMIGLSLAVRPIFYSLLSPIISKFKYTTLHTHFDSFRFTTMQAGLGKKLWKHADDLTKRRQENGESLTKIFKNKDGFTIPSIPITALVAFNQFPVIVHDLNRRKMLVYRLLAQGIETTFLYEKPLHHIFPELNPGGDAFPNATYLAEHLLLIPPHTQISQTIIKNIRNVVESI
ncbi:MAG: aminotransferase class V-fold PLP-dependent enzyme [Candidatus Marinimicrobia bacterium]|nr:aminotransferase class V-fold PLP-dependent enzyme [Candidatus Neomarinimicrobiota bacterium]